MSTILPNVDALCTECNIRPFKYKKTQLCQACSDRIRRANNPPCTIEGCTARQDNVTYGLCYHHNRVRRQEGKTCEGEKGNCPVKVDRAGYCQRHYLDYKNGLSTDRPIADYESQPEECTWSEDCHEKAACRKVCKSHYLSWQRKNDPERYYEVVSRNHLDRRAREAGTHIETLNPYILLERDGNLCCYCKRTMSWDVEECNTGHYRTVEHVTSLFHNGDGAYSNAKLACRSCNSSKRDKSLWEFLIWLMEQEEAGLLDYSTGRFREEPLFEPADLIHQV